MSRSSVPAKRGAEAQEAAWVAGEDRFVLQQARKKAAIRAKNGRAQPIDWLMVILSIVDPNRNYLDDELDVSELDVINPQALFEELDGESLIELERKIDTFETLETSRSNRDYWTMMKTICRDRRQQTRPQSMKGVNPVSSDMEKLLADKTLPELEKLERQVNAKLESDEAVDVDYWEDLLASLLTHKAHARLQHISEALLGARSSHLRKRQASEADVLRQRLISAEAGPHESLSDTSNAYISSDPDPLLRLRPEDKNLRAVNLAVFDKELTTARDAVLKSGNAHNLKRFKDEDQMISKRPKLSHDTNSSTLSAAFDREVARGLGDNEEIFATEVDVVTKNKHSWANKFRPRKPQYFNRVSLGYEWNKYNQTHYDQDNPPPKVVQGYSFNIFYPDLADKTKGPTYRIEREDGRRRGESTAPAGEDDTCIIHFIAGPPYEDVAFRIVDKEWDYSAKRERGFRSSFDKGILELQFQFKKIYYRK